MFSRTPEKGIIQEAVHAISYSLFVPMFFVSIGLSMDLTALSLNTVWLILAISAIAILGKMLGVGGGARINHFSWRESLQLGSGMVARGEVSLIIAKVGLDDGFISANVFSAVVAMVLVTALLTPPLLRIAFRERPEKKTINPDDPQSPDMILEKESS
jgi:Kef-type K+ transport system membrane component KefB